MGISSVRCYSRYKRPGRLLPPYWVYVAAPRWPGGGIRTYSAHVLGQRRSAPVSAGQRRSAPVSAGQRGAGSDPQRPEGAWGGRGGCLGVPWGGGVGVQAFAGGCHLTELTGFIGHNFTEPEQVSINQQHLRSLALP